MTRNPGKVLLVPEEGDGGRVVECLMTQFEPLVYDVLCDYLPDGANAAEIGCFEGGLTCLFLHGMGRRCKKLALTCHDLFEPFNLEGELIDIEPNFDDNVRDCPGMPIKKCKGDSKVTHEVHDDASLDMCFIDGDHSYEGALADITNFLPKVKDGGWLIVRNSIGDVQRALIDADVKWPSTLVQPPFGHYVTVFNRNASLLRAYMNRLEKVTKDVYIEMAFPYPE